MRFLGFQTKTIPGKGSVGSVRMLGYVIYFGSSAYWIGFKSFLNNKTFLTFLCDLGNDLIRI